jgi:hypothetical protein
MRGLIELGRAYLRSRSSFPPLTLLRLGGCSPAAPPFLHRRASPTAIHADRAGLQAARPGHLSPTHASHRHPRGMHSRAASWCRLRDGWRSTPTLVVAIGFGRVRGLVHVMMDPESLHSPTVSRFSPLLLPHPSPPESLVWSANQTPDIPGARRTVSAATDVS